ncbi:hypothetical protein [Nocardioides sp. W7]|uniref:hypothetical protein n=1 Tax=Nocardioides sp. W7 TaxID=2931390 RepID=UPI001FD19523|nr:hypothetical protein [Nocardioides sp. W7]
MRARLRPVLVVTLVLVLVATAAVLSVRWWRDAHRTELERAFSLAPSEIERASWTAWGAVRRELGVDELDELLAAGYDADLTSASALVESAPLLQEEYGWSPATVDWELFSQSEAGAAVVVGLPDDLDVDDVGDRLEALGYTRPDDATGVWKGGEELVATVAAGRPSSPVLQYVALDADEQLLTLSDNVGYLGSVIEDRGGEDRLTEVVDAVGDPLSASVFRGSYACSALAMGQADPADQAEADELLAAAGEVHPMTAFAMAVQPDRDVLVAMAFENDDQARADADSRAVLASGPAPGQGGSFSDRFTLGDVVADGTVVTLPLRPAEGAYVLSDLSSGPVLFATC